MDRYTKWIFIGPAAIVLMLMLVFPFGYTAYLSLFEWFAAGPPPKFVGIQNYIELGRDPRFLNALWNTFLYTVGAVSIEIVLGIAFALLLHQKIFGRGFVRTTFLLPMVATPVAISLVWLLMFDPASGVLNYFLISIGLPPSVWVNNARLAIPALVLVDVWQWTPLVMLIVLGGLTSLPPEPFEAASIDGANAWQTFRHLTLPLLRPYIVVAALFRGIDAIKTFDTIFVITKGGPAFASETLNLYIYSSAFDYLHIGYSSTMLVVVFVIVVGFGLLELRVGRVATT